MEAKFKVRQDLGSWNGIYQPGTEYTIQGTREQMETIEAAYKAGALVDVSYDDEAADAVGTYVEDDLDSLAKLQAAQESGAWLEGHLAQFNIEAENGGLIEVGGGE